MTACLSPPYTCSYLLTYLLGYYRCYYYYNNHHYNYCYYYFEPSVNIDNVKTMKSDSGRFAVQCVQ